MSALRPRAPARSRGRRQPRRKATSSSTRRASRCPRDARGSAPPEEVPATKHDARERERPTTAVSVPRSVACVSSRRARGHTSWGADDMLNDAASGHARKPRLNVPGVSHASMSAGMTMTLMNQAARAPARARARKAAAGRSAQRIERTAARRRRARSKTFELMHGGASGARPQLLVGGDARLPP